MGRPKYLTCPFWKLDPSKYWNCFSKELRETRDIKQHLQRRHTPIYCEKCLTIFGNEQRKDEHIEHVDCRFTPGKKLEGVTYKQKSQLSRSPRGTVEERWLKIWEILFPGMPRPSSIYVLPDQGEVICQLRDVFDRHLVGIMVDELRTHGYILRPGVTDEQLEGIGRTAMRRMLDHFRIRPPGAASASPQRSHVPMVGSDSGIGVASGFSATGSRIDTPSSYPVVDSGHLAPQMPEFENLQRNDSCLAHLAGPELDADNMEDANFSWDVPWDPEAGSYPNFGCMLESIAVRGTLEADSIPSALSAD